jgi:8-oxo-dGTP pyrophosphatase MutT (NUDIX family)
MTWQVLHRTKLLDRWPHIRVFRERLITDAGEHVEAYYQLEATSFVVIFPVMADGRIALIQHYRHALGRVVFDLPGGGIETPETPLQSARRELREEAGLTAPSWHHLGTFRLSQVRGIADAHCYLAQQAQQTHTPTSDDLGEVTVAFRTADEVRSMWASGGWPVMVTACAVGLGLAHL